MARAALTASSARCRTTRFGQEQATSLSQPHGFGAAFQEQEAEFLLQIADLPAQRGLRNVKLQRRARDVFFFRNADEVTDVAQFHEGKTIILLKLRREKPTN
jgi:hypothetical protein